MQSVTLRAHFNGIQVVLDEPFAIKADTKLLVTVLPDKSDAETDEWFRLSGEHFNSAFGEDEPEYGFDDLVEVNPEYDRG